MLTSSQTDRERAEEAAAVWLVLLSEAADDTALRAHFEAWRSASDLNREIWARTWRAYHLVGKSPAHHRDHWEAYAAGREIERALPSASAALPATSRPALRSGSPRPGRVIVALATAALAACLAIVLLPEALLRLDADVLTSTGELRSIRLEDGTQIQLAPESDIDVEFRDGERHVRLLKGRAFFEVARDVRRPFRVSAGDTVTTVLGTAFEVHRGEDGTTVTVQHGNVRVDDTTVSPPLSEELHDGNQLRVSRASDVSRSSSRPDEIATWLRGELVARNRPVGEIVSALRPYFSGVILVRNDAFASRQVSGIYDLRDPAHTLRALAASYDAAVMQISPWVLVVTAR